MEKHYEEKAFEMLSKLVSFRSISVKENSADHPFGIENKKTLDYMLDTARADGFTVYNASNYAGHIEYGEGEEIFGIFGHLDVVEPNYPGQPDWTYDPWTLTRVDGKLVGRGVLDDKGGVVAAYIALLMLKDLGIKPKKRIRLFVGCNEENGFGCLKKYLEEMPKPDAGVAVDDVFPVVNVASGTYDVDLLVEDEIIESFEAGNKYGQSPAFAKVKIDPTKEYLKAHEGVSFDGLASKALASLEHNHQLGEIKDGSLIVRRRPDCKPEDIFFYNSAELLFLLLSEKGIPLADFMGKYFVLDHSFTALGFRRETPHPIWGFTTNTLSVVDIHEHKGRIGLRFVAPEADEAKRILEKLKEAAAKCGYGCRVVTWEDNKRVDPESPLVKYLDECYRDVSGDRTSDLTDKLSGSTYSRYLENVVAFGPRFPDRGYACHIADEFYYEKDFRDLIEIYFRAIKKMAEQVRMRHLGRAFL